MEAYILQKEEHQKISRVAFLVAIACVLQIAESLFPHPIPGLRLGLANIITLITLVTMGFGVALEVSVLRTLVSSFIMGTFMSPTFMLSFGGALLSTIVMGFLYWLVCRTKYFPLSIVGISIMGALVHNLTQLFLAYFLLVKHPGIFVFWPWLAIGAVAMGWFSGVVSGRVCSQLQTRIAAPEWKSSNQNTQPAGVTPGFHYYSPGNSFLHTLPAHYKIIAVLLMALLVIIFDNFWLYLGVLTSLTAIIMTARLSWLSLFFRVKRYFSLILVAFFLPVLFNHSGRVIYSLAQLKLTTAGLNTGFLFGTRIIFLLVANFLLFLTTSPEDLTTGLKKTLSPLKVLGVSPERTAAILSLSLLSIPGFWEHAKKSIQQLDFKKIKNMRAIIPAVETIILSLYLCDERQEAVAARGGELSPAKTPLVYKDIGETV